MLRTLVSAKLSNTRLILFLNVQYIMYFPEYCFEKSSVPQCVSVKFENCTSNYCKSRRNVLNRSITGKGQWPLATWSLMKVLQFRLLEWYLLLLSINARRDFLAPLSLSFMACPGNSRCLPLVVPQKMILELWVPYPGIVCCRFCLCGWSYNVTISFNG